MANTLIPSRSHRRMQETRPGFSPVGYFTLGASAPRRFARQRYQIVKSRAVFIDIGSVASGLISGTFTGTGTLSGTIGAKGDLAGSMAGAGSMVGTLGAKGDLAGSMAATGTFSGTIFDASAPVVATAPFIGSGFFGV